MSDEKKRIERDKIEAYEIVRKHTGDSDLIRIRGKVWDEYELCWKEESR